MNNKSINARMQQKIDTYENWSKATNFIPLKGELIIYTTDENGNEKIGFKVGTGEPDKNIHQLDFVSLSEAAATVSWNDLTDKPFGETGFKIEWEGNIEGLSTFNLLGEFDFYKVSSDTIDISGAEIISYFDGDDIVGNIGVDSSLMLVNTDNGNQGCLYNGQLPIVIIVNNAGVDFILGTEIAFPEEGIWFFRGIGEKEFVQSLQKNYSFKILDEKYIPDIYLKSATAGALNGVATLDDAGKVPLVQLPNDIDNLSNYYTKSEIDNLIGNCDAVIDSINILIGGENI